LAPAPAGLLTSGHERPVRSADGGELTRPLVGRLGDAQMKPGPA
jgi:hypothetical protein